MDINYNDYNWRKFSEACSETENQIINLKYN